jgi:hypothetical protein
MDKEAWEAIIPSMGYMALLRNLRNFDQAVIDPAVGQYVVDRLTDPKQVEASMQFPFRFYSAWKSGVSLFWGQALERALEMSTRNIPTFSGRTLVIVDVSGSMQGGFSARSSMAPIEAGMVFGASIFQRNPANTTLVGAATSSAEIPWQGSVLRTTEWIRQRLVGEATYLARAMDNHWDNHDRIILVSDGQFHDRPRDFGGLPIYLFNLGGYRPVPFRVGAGSVHELGGLSDATFRLIPLLENQQKGVWPWEVMALAE